MAGNDAVTDRVAGDRYPDRRGDPEPFGLQSDDVDAGERAAFIKSVRLSLVCGSPKGALDLSDHRALALIKEDRDRDRSQYGDDQDHDDELDERYAALTPPRIAG
jgi:hypothetical protein